MKAGIFAALLALLAFGAGCSKTNNNSVYVLGQGTNDVFGFKQNASGALQPFTGTPLSATGSVPVAVLIHPSRQFAYIANFSDGTITVLIRNVGNGELSVPPLPPNTINTPPPIIAGTNPVSMALTADGRFVYVLNQGSNDISAFTVDVGNDTLDHIANPAKDPITNTPLATFPTAANPIFMVVSPDSKSLYVASVDNLANPTVGSISGFSINSDGTLTALQSPAVTAGVNPTFLAIEPRAKFLYASDHASNSILAFSIQAGGALSPVSGSPFPAGTNPSGLAINTSGTFLLAANQGSNNISGFTISGTGALSAVAGSPFTAGVNPVFVAFDRANNFVYVADQGSNDIGAFALINGTQLRSLVGAPFAIGTSPSWIATTP
ncbi:MAG TPA: beta-propeller fold lactonase family protein [Candidatus Angelobacter sp.]|nr:beta-propeller fold lactonase family protein [Candidatus Angelobacter sp.]